MRRLLVVLAVCGAACFSAPVFGGLKPAAPPELHLLPPVVVEGGESWSIEERLKHYNVPGVSVAVIENGRVVFARGYGYADVEKKRPMTTGTLMLAGSVSKPVTAIAAIDLVERGKLPLDADVNSLLRSWQLPSNELTQNTPVTLRHLLSHSAGTTVHGFPGYKRDEPIPTTKQVLDGAEPANTPPVRVDLAPNTKFRYSGGGTTVAQLALSETAGESFPSLMRRLVLAPLGMRTSTYENPLPAAKHARAAKGYRASGRLIPGGWHVYPEMAAAGLWTTPSELARVAIEMGDALAGRPTRVLSIDGARLMLTPRFEVSPTNDIGIGWFLDDRGTFGHDGSDEGFITRFVASKDGTRAFVIMVNSDAGGPLLGELDRGIMRAFGWPGVTAPRATRAFTAEMLDRLPGRYKQGPDRILSVRRSGDTLELRTVDGRWVRLYHLDDGTITRTDADQRFRLTDDGLEIVADKPTPLPRTTEAPAPSELLAEGRTEEAVTAYRASKPDVLTLNRLGGSYQRFGRRYREAVAILRVATELYPESSNAWDSLASALADSGDFPGAIEATNNALARVDADKVADETQKFWIRLLGKTRLRELASR
ncbi:MAG TPA: serine hydrolase [Thermoanaerobaculia bacterium]|nr:serine hydrolase [Thermoanaerobaculia bacterium]